MVIIKPMYFEGAGEKSVYGGRRVGADVSA